MDILVLQIRKILHCAKGPDYRVFSVNNYVEVQKMSVEVIIQNNNLQETSKQVNETNCYSYSSTRLLMLLRETK